MSISATFRWRVVGECDFPAKVLDDMKPNFYEIHRAEYLALYRAYYVLNFFCWRERLPRTEIRLYRQCGFTLAYASKSSPPRIAFNLFHLGRVDLPNIEFFALLAHEMTHVWQYTEGRRGGHGKDFRDEMRRIGIEERRGFVAILPGSPFATAVNFFRWRSVQYGQVLASLAKGGYSRTGDRVFFRNNQEALYK